jgi:hypothetical protein
VPWLGRAGVARDFLGSPGVQACDELRDGCSTGSECFTAEFTDNNSLYKDDAEKSLASIPAICAGGEGTGAIGKLSARERYELRGRTLGGDGKAQRSGPETSDRHGVRQQQQQRADRRK